MDLSAINTPTAALLAGLVTSLHCAGMCGPLACMLGPAKGERADATTVNTVYQMSRLAGYATLGAVAGAAGMIPRSFFNEAVVRWFPWLLVVFFVLVALRLDHRLPRLVWLSRWSLKIQARLRSRPRVQVAAAMGALTPLLPCGPLYFLVTFSAMSGSALRGVEFMLAFGIGTVPMLWLAQTQFGWLRRHLSPVSLARFQTALAVIAALVISWRLRATLGFDGPTVDQFLCH
jgi:sulfite exporter TauE/SafE